MTVTLRVETPCTYISASDRVSVRLLRKPFSKRLWEETALPHLGHGKGNLAQRVVCARCDP